MLSALYCLVFTCTQPKIVPPVKLREPIPVITQTVRISYYSSLDSCHYPKGDGCLTASGTIAKAYHTAACPKDLPFGSTFTYKGTEWTCEDRTATWVQNDLGRTFDLFLGYGEEAHREAISNGAKLGEIVL